MRQLATQVTSIFSETASRRDDPTPVLVLVEPLTGVQGQASSGATLARVAVALYAGSFDPIHLGHLGVIEHAARTYEQVVVAVVANPEKPAGMFRPEERLRLLTGATAHLPTVRSVQFYGLTVALARSEGAQFWCAPPTRSEATSSRWRR